MTMILLSLLFQTLGAFAFNLQHATGSSMSPQDRSDSIKYFIKTVPLDTTQKMPTYKPDDFIPVDGQPVPIKQVAAEYPDTAQPGPGGTVWLSCLIRKDGTVGTVKVVRTEGPRLVAPAIAAVKQWRFTPAKQAGKPIAVWAAIPIRVPAKY